MPASFLVHRNPIHARVGKCGNKFVGVLDHQVAVERQFGVLADRGDDGRPDGDVGDKVAVHHVDMDDGAAAALGRGDFIGEAGKVGGKDGWDELDHSTEQGTGWRVQGKERWEQGEGRSEPKKRA